jgi:hypothetical protein
MSQEQRGFASMDPAARRELARRAGRAAHQQGRAHEWSSEEARAAGRKGGGVLLRSGDDSINSRLAAVASALEDIATMLDQLSSDGRGAAKTQVINLVRQSVVNVSRAVDRIANKQTIS